MDCNVENWGSMGRIFPFLHQDRELEICVVPIDEGWELWVVEGDRRLACGARVSVDEATDAGRRGEDRVLAVAEDLKSQIRRTWQAGSRSFRPRMAESPEIRSARIVSIEVQ